jgi:serine phosphatase RsbU (regulator of sigma subunit)
MRWFLAILTSIYSLLTLESVAQESTSVTDSLLQAIQETEETDTAKVTLYAYYSENINNSDATAAKEYAEKGIQLGKKLKHKVGTSHSYNALGLAEQGLGNYDASVAAFEKSIEMDIEIGRTCVVATPISNMAESFRLTSQFDKALEHYRKAMSIHIDCGDSNGAAKSLVNIGIVYDVQGKVTEAMEQYMQALPTFERAKNDQAVSSVLLNIGILHYRMKDLDKAIEFHRRSAVLKKKVNDRYGTAHIFNNIGSFYIQGGNLDSGAYYMEQSLVLRKKLNDKQGISMSLSNLGRIYVHRENYSKAEQYYLEAMVIKEEIKDLKGLISVYSGLADIRQHHKDYAKAITYYLKSLEMAKSLGVKSLEETMYHHLATVNAEKGDFRKAYDYLMEFALLRDTLLNESRTKQISELNTKYETEKKEQEISLLSQKQKIDSLTISQQDAEAKKKDAEIVLREAEVKDRNFFITLISSGLLFVIVLALLIYRSYLNKQKANQIISAQKAEVEHQKELVDEKNREITDSIEYAKTLQEAILPPTKLVKEFLPDSFILYKPKDIVSGDFYWMETTPQKGVLFAAVDCTGHGVPGAMVSVVGHNGLNRCVKEFGITQPAAILNKLTELVEETFEKSESDVKDGMDIALCHLNYETKTVQYAGANNPLWIVRPLNDPTLVVESSAEEQPETITHQLNNFTLYEVKANSQPIGKYSHRQDFTNQTIQLQKGDTLYIFSDGFADQFGGPKGKKFKQSQFRETLLSIQDQPLEEQRNTLHQTIEKWKGEIEQIDDICVIGVRV